MKKISGIYLVINFSLSSLIQLTWLWMKISDEEWELNLDPPIPLLLILFLTSVIGIYYVIVTKFGVERNKAIHHLDLENEIIRKQIEKRELLEKLKELESR